MEAGLVAREQGLVVDTRRPAASAKAMPFIATTETRRDNSPPSAAEKAEPPVADGSAEAQPLTTAEETNVWPTESEEAAFLAESRGQSGSVAAVPVRSENAQNEEAEETSKPLPKLDELVNRIPDETRELLEDLFRAKFTTVRRVKKRDLKA